MKFSVNLVNHNGGGGGSRIVYQNTYVYILLQWNDSKLKLRCTKLHRTVLHNNFPIPEMLFGIHHKINVILREFSFQFISRFTTQWDYWVLDTEIR